jgi:signal transduction histidine kinase
MIRAFQQLRLFVLRHAPYPLALQGIIALTLLGTPFSGLGLRDPLSLAADPQRFSAMTLIVGLHLVLCMLVPARRIQLWAQICYLTLQCALTAIAQALYPAPLLDYVYLTIVLQALTLFRPWLWIPFAVGVWALWSGGVIIATASVLAWLQSNLALAFPATCAIIAAIVYLRQQRRSEQAQQRLLQVQQRYDLLLTDLRETQQRVMLEERRRLAQLLTGDVQAALARAEQSVAAAIGQAQTNLSRLQLMLAQTRDSAGAAVERLRGAVATLRYADLDEPPRGAARAVLVAGPLDELVISSLPNRVLTWVLPLVFVSLSLLIILLQHWPSPEVLGLLVVFYALLLLAYIYTQRARQTFLFQIGLVGQTLALVAMATLTQALPILLGLLLVLWQIALRLPVNQILVFLAGVPVAIGVVVARLRPQRLDYESLLVCAVAAAAVAGPLLLARRQLDRRHQAELRAELLAGEIEQQLGEVRTLAVARERSRLAREFHDDLGSRLMLINLQLQLAEELAGEDADSALAQLQTSREQLHAAWRSVLSVADAELPLDGTTLTAALHELVGQCRRSAAAAIDLLLDGPLDELPLVVACTIYRAAQEGLTNACKHARASQIGLQIRTEAGYVIVTVLNDDRRDLAPPLPSAGAASFQGSFGLVGLRERAEDLGGGVEAGPLPEGGYRMRLVLPAEGG